MTNYRLVVAAVSIPTITAIFGLLWFWDRKKKKELVCNDSSSVLEALNKNANSFSGSCSSLYETSEPLNNGTNSIAVISGDDNENDEYTKQLPLGQDWIQKINSSFLNNDSEDSISSEANIDAISKICVADQDSEALSICSEASNELTNSLSSGNWQTPKIELNESEPEGPTKLEEKSCTENLEEVENNERQSEIVINECKEEQEKDLIPDVKNELLISEDVKPLLATFDKDHKEKLAKDNSAGMLEGISVAWAYEKVQPSVESFEDDDNEHIYESVSKEMTSEEETDDQSELPQSKSNGIGSEKATSLISALDGNDVETGKQVEDLFPEVKNHCQKLLESEELSESESTNSELDSLNGNYEEDEQSEELTLKLGNGMCSEVITNDGCMSESEETNPFLDECELDQRPDDAKESSLDINLPSKPIDAISAVFSGGQLNDSQLTVDLVQLEAHATKMSTPNHATSEKLLSHAKQLFHETDSITPPETDSDTYLSSKEMMSETLESDQTELSLTPNPSNQSEDEENEMFSPLSSSPQGDQVNQLNSLSNNFFKYSQISADEKTFVSLDDSIAESEATNSELFKEKASSPISDKSSNSDFTKKADNLEQCCTKSSSESESLLPPVENITEHSTENIVAENTEKELEKIKDVTQDLGKILQRESRRTLNGKNLVASQPSQETTKTLDETLYNARDFEHNNNNNSAYTGEQENHHLGSNAVIRAESGPEKTSPPKEQEIPDSVLSSNCDVKNTKSFDINKMAVKTKSSTLYEFYFPSELCGRLIGRQGKNIIHIKERSGASVSLQPSPYTPNHQICSIEGTQEEIDEALKCISQKFPNSIYPNVDLTAITDSTQLASSPMVVPDLIQLSLPPEGVSIDILVASLVDGGHLFLQLPTHPTYAALERLNQFMNRCYSQPGMVPQLPRPLIVGVICAAPVMEGWYRAVIVAVSEETDECEIKFVDYGGFSQVPGNLLRQIRSDFMTLPFQAIEVYLANITPLQNENYFSERAVEILQELTENGILQAQVVSRAEDGTPYVHIYQINGNKVTFVNRELVNRGAVRWIEVL